MKIVRTAQAQWVDAMAKGSFGQRRKALGGEKLSCGLWELPPGKKSFPLHSHHVTEEAMFVISGTAKVRTPEGVTELAAGDYVSFPPGGLAHQLINDGTEPMVYLAMSATQGVDIVEYPDSDKVAAAVGAYPNTKRYMFKKGDQVEYFAGEKDAT
ncbi:MAG: cupin protein [Myxococcaceae bacterium]|nr:cupin protein [Myxococcaceae bacterium]